MKLLQFFKRSVFVSLLVIVIISLASCTTSNVFKIINDNDELVIVDSEDNEITKKEYGNNKKEEITIKLDKKKVSQNQQTITRKVSLNGIDYIFTPFTKSFDISLSNKNVNEFVSQKEPKKSFKIEFHEHYFDVAIGEKRVQNGETCLEASELVIKPKNLPEGYQVKINNKLQASRESINYFLEDDTQISYFKLSDEGLTDEEILANQLRQLEINLTLPDTSLDQVSRTFSLPKSFDKTITSSHKIKEQNLPAGLSIQGDKFVIADGFNTENPVPVTIIVELKRNNTVKSKEFAIKVVKSNDISDGEVTTEILKNLLVKQNYYLLFDGNDNFASVKNNVQTKKPGSNLTLDYEVLDHNDNLVYNKNNQVFEIKNSIETNTQINIKATISYLNTVNNQTIVASENFTLTFVPTIIYETRDYDIASIIEINASNLPNVNGKRVIKREIFDESVFQELEVNKDKTKFIFKKLGRTDIIYRLHLEDNTTCLVGYTYNVNLPKEHTYINRYLTTLENSYKDFKSYKNNTPVLDTVKIVGTDNKYLPDIVLKYNGYKLTSDKLDFEKTEVLSELDFTKDIFKVVITSGNNNQVHNEELYTFTGTSFKFEEQENEDLVYTIKYFLIGTDTLLFSEKVQVKPGVNAYEDYELRKYFRESFTYDNIYLQRNIMVVERPEVVKQQTLPSGEIVSYRDYNSSHECDYEVTFINDQGEKETGVYPLFDSEGNITKQQQYYQGSVYYRYFSVNGSRKSEYKPVKFDGNHYTVNASNLNYCYQLQSYLPVPDVQCAIFDIDSANGLALNYKDTNEIKNIQIISNGGISGKTIKFSEGNEFSVLAGAIHSLRTRYSKVNYDDIITKDANGVLYATGSEVNVKHLTTTNSFGFNIYFRNRFAQVEEHHDIPMTRLQVKDSYFGETGGIGITISDGDRRVRIKDKNLSEYIIKQEVNGNMVDCYNTGLHNEENTKRYQYEDFDNNVAEDRIKYSCDPSAVFENTIFESFVSTESSLVKSFNIGDKIQLITEYEEQIKNAVGIEILKKEDNLIKLNFALALINNYILDKPTAELSSSSGEVERSFFYNHDTPRWDINLNGTTQYYPGKYYTSLTPDSLAKLDEYKVAITGPGKDYVEYYNSQLANQAALGAIIPHLLQLLGEQQNDPLKHFIQVIPISEFPIYNYGTENGRLPAQFIIGYKRIK